MKQANIGLWLATFAFAVNFSVWSLYGVTGLHLEFAESLSSTQLGLLLGAPLLSSAVLFVPAGILSQRYSPRMLMIVQMMLTLPALLLLPKADELHSYLLLGVWLGISGTSFVFGLAYIKDWFQPGQQGTSMGVFGAGNVGAIITFLLAPIIIDQYQASYVGPVFALLLFIALLLFALFAPKTISSKGAPSHRSINTLMREPRVWRLGLYYFFVFGSFLALLMWLPNYYSQAYDLELTQASAFTMVFVACSSLIRALGGWFSDRYGGRTINWGVFWVCIVCLFFLSYPPTTMTIHGIERDVVIDIEVNLWVFSILICIIGLAQGIGRASVFKLINDYYPNELPQVAGIVASMGTFGACLLAMLFGLTEAIFDIHSAAFMLLYGCLALCMVTMHFANRADRQQQRLEAALDNNFLEMD